MKAKHIGRKFFSFIKKYFVIFCVALIFLFMFFCDNVGGTFGKNLMDNLRSVANTFTPTTDLFDDGSEVSFVSYLFGFQNQTKQEKAVFSYPTNQPNTSNTDECLSYKYTGVVCAISDGKVFATGYNQNGEKYVEIEHNEGYTSKYVGLEYVGTSTGAKVRRGNGIGVSSKDHAYKVYIFKNSTIVKTSEILWQN